MRFEVREAICEPGSVDRPNDDAWGATGHSAFVLDGATGLADMPVTGGASDAAWIAQTARDALLASPKRPARDTVAALVDQVIEAFARDAVRPVSERYETPTSSLCLLIGGEAALFGDCRALARLPDGTIVNIGPSGKGRAMERARAQQHAGGDVSNWKAVRAQALPELRRLRNMINTGPGTGVLAPDRACLDYVRIKPAAFPSGSEVLLMTDGFYALVADYGAYDDAGLIAAADLGGLAPLYAELRAIEAADPTGARYPRFKKSDDATALFVRVA